MLYVVLNAFKFNNKHCTKTFPADLVTFTEEIINGKLHFLCSERQQSDVRIGRFDFSISNFEHVQHNNLIFSIAALNMPLLSDVNRSSRPEVFCIKVVFRNFAKFTGKHLCQRLFLNKVAGLRTPFLQNISE